MNKALKSSAKRFVDGLEPGDSLSVDGKVIIGKDADGNLYRDESDDTRGTVITMTAATMTADITNALTGWFKAHTKPWSLMSYDEQASLIAAASKLSQDTVREAVQIIAAEGRKVIMAHVEKVEFAEKGIKATLSASKSSEYRHDLADSQGLDVLIVVADAGEFNGGELQEPDAPKDNQESLALDDDRPVFDNTDNGRVE